MSPLETILISLLNLRKGVIAYNIANYENKQCYLCFPLSLPPGIRSVTRVCCRRRRPFLGVRVCVTNGTEE